TIAVPSESIAALVLGGLTKRRPARRTLAYVTTSRAAYGITNGYAPVTVCDPSPKFSNTLPAKMSQQNGFEEYGIGWPALISDCTLAKISSVITTRIAICSRLRRMNTSGATNGRKKSALFCALNTNQW